jgi:repressor LexA
MLTERQREIRDFIRDFGAAQGAAPTVAEIQRHFRFKSPATVTEHLDALERRGAIRRTPGRARNIRVVGEAEARTIPVFGAIPAGFAEMAEVQADRTLAFDAAALRLPRTARVFGLEVRGDSMTGAGILDGDLVLLEHGPAPQDGDIVAALIDGETTLKRFRMRNGRPVLQAENPAYPELTPVRDLQVQGIYRGLVRVAGEGSHGGR